MSLEPFERRVRRPVLDGEVDSSWLPDIWRATCERRSVADESAVTAEAGRFLELMVPTGQRLTVAAG